MPQQIFKYRLWFLTLDHKVSIKMILVSILVLSGNATIIRIVAIRYWDNSQNISDASYEKTINDASGMIVSI